MERVLKSEIEIIGIELSKHCFLMRVAADGSVVFRRKMHRGGVLMSLQPCRPVLWRWKPAGARITGGEKWGSWAMSLGWLWRSASSRWSSGRRTIRR